MYSPSAPTLVLNTCVLLGILIVEANSHGIMCTPRQRGAYQSVKCPYNLPEPRNPVIDYCAHCLSGGSVGAVKQNLPLGGWRVYDPTKRFFSSANRAGLCGDPKGDASHMIGGTFMPYDTVPIVNHYKSGGLVDFTVEIDTNHNGYFDFYLCNLDECGTSDIAAKCFTGGRCYQLQRVKHPNCEARNVNTDYDCGPVDPTYPGRWYLPCRKTGYVGVHMVGGKSGTMRYKLPDGVVCKHCVIQWYYATANSCAPQGFLDYFIRFKNPFGTTCESDGGGFGAHRPGMTQCGGDLLPEEFWSCADVQIYPNGKAAGLVRAVGSLKKDFGAAYLRSSRDFDVIQKNPESFVEMRKKDNETDIVGEDEIDIW